MQRTDILGVDVGASGIKGAIVDVQSGTLLTERLRFETPEPATPTAMAETFKQLVDHFNWDGKVIGCGFPSVVIQGVAKSAANIDKAWVGTNIETLFSEASGRTVHAINDADAAGIASVLFGNGRGVKGTILFITIGSGLGSAILVNGHLVRNTELGHLYMDDTIAEKYASARVRKREGLSWDEWGYRFNLFLQHLERIFSPDLILLGGGGSKKFDRYMHRLHTQAPVKPEGLQNQAGIIGAAYFAAHYRKTF